jgi:hypothetical protein
MTTHPKRYSSTLIMEEIGFSETIVLLQRSTRLYIPEDILPPEDGRSKFY